MITLFPAFDPVPQLVTNVRAKSVIVDKKDTASAGHGKEEDGSLTEETMPLPDVVRYRLLRRTMTLAAEVPASTSTRRAWVGVHPLGDTTFDVHYFEVEAESVEAVENTWDYDEFLLNNEYIHVSGEDELERVLTRWLDDFGKLVQPYFCSYPI